MKDLSLEINNLKTHVFHLTICGSRHKHGAERTVLDTLHTHAGV